MTVPNVPELARLTLPTKEEMSAWTDEQIVEAHAAITSAIEQLAVLKDDAANVLALRMGENTMEIGDFEVERSRSSSTTWDAARAREVAKEKIVRELCTDPASGEVHLPLRRVAEAAIEKAYSFTSTGDKASLGVRGLQALGVDPNQYRSSNLGKWTLKVSPRRLRKGEA